MIRKSYAALVLAGVISAILPGGAMADGVGSTGAQFLEIGIGARALAMGGAFSAVADNNDANSALWNPGSLAQVRERSVTTSYSSLFLDENQGYLGYAQQMLGGTVALGVDYLGVSNIETRTSDTETPDSTISNGNMAVVASYARPDVMKGLSLGVNVKYIRETLDSYFTYNAAAADVGALYQTPIDKLTAGFSVQNLGTKIGPDPLPMLVKTGAAYKVSSPFTLAMDGDWYPVDQRAFLDVGAEVWLHPSLALRGGYKFGQAQDELGGAAGLSGGAGLKFGRFTLDYAFVPFGDMGNTQRMTMGYSF
jgi:hypothetical protein